jgi:DNA-binding transcriptional LysR family regulator
MFVPTHLKSLQALELALRSGSLKGAADLLWITPAAVGQRVKALRRTGPERGIRFQRLNPALEAVLADAGFTICGLALISSFIEQGTVSLPFPLATGTWTDHAFQARIRSEALMRPHVRRFKEWLVKESGVTRQWLLQTARARRRAG